MKIYNFNNFQQADYYDATRPKYTKEIFEYILNKVTNKENFLDIACGTGQLTFPLSEYFSNLNIGVDISKEPITIAKKKLTEKTNKISFFESDIYELDNYLNTKQYGTDKIFDLITIGQAIHWFEEDKILPFLQNILKDDGTIAIIGYKKQHFLASDPLFQLFENLYNLLNPYFECDNDNIDNHYYKIKFDKYFVKEEATYYTEESYITLNKLIEFLQSWSGYHNYIKVNKEDPLIQFRKECKIILKSENDDLKIIKFYNFYHLTILHK